MTPMVRKATLTAHVTTAVGWLGAVAGFLVLSIAGVASQEADLVRGAYLTMQVLGWALIVPLSIGALVTGLFLALQTEWGLIRMYWVVVKFGLTLLASLLLLLHQITAVTEAARRVSLSPPGIRPDMGQLGVQLVIDASLAVVVLLVITTLSVFKPGGLTAFGRRRLDQLRRARAPEMGQSPQGMATPGNASSSSGSPHQSPEFAESTSEQSPSDNRLMFTIVGITMGVVLAVIVLKHLLGGGHGRHGQ